MALFFLLTFPPKTPARVMLKAYGFFAQGLSQALHPDEFLNVAITPSCDGVQLC